MSLLVSGVIIWGTWGLLKDSVNLVLDAVPEGIDPVEVRKHLEELEGVVSVHDLHIWGMSTTEAALTVHHVRDKVMVDNAFLVDAAEKLHDEFGIEHATVQVETVKDAPLHQGCEA